MSSRLSCLAFFVGVSQDVMKRIKLAIHHYHNYNECYDSYKDKPYPAMASFLTKHPVFS